MLVNTPLPDVAVQAIQTQLHAVPMNASVGVTITGVGAGWATGSCPLLPAYQDEREAMHSGAQFLLAEAVSSAALEGAFAEYLSEAVPTFEKMDVQIVGQAVGAVTARAICNPDDLPGACTAFERMGHASLNLHITVMDERNRVVMNANAHWHIKRHHKDSDCTVLEKL